MNYAVITLVENGTQTAALEYVVGVFLDLKKSFDTAKPIIIAFYFRSFMLFE